MFRSGLDRARQIEFLSRALTHPAPEPPERNLDIARAKLHRVIEVAELPLVPDLHCAPVPAFVLRCFSAMRLSHSSGKARASTGLSPAMASTPRK